MSKVAVLFRTDKPLPGPPAGAAEIFPVLFKEKLDELTV